jgi:hypothetical protein
MNNIKYNIKEKIRKTKQKDDKKTKKKQSAETTTTELFVQELIQNMHRECPDELIEEHPSKDDYVMDNDSYMVQELDYQENYTVKMLAHILDYYDISKRKMKKTDMIYTIIDFENNEENTIVVEERKMKWFYMNELRDDPFFQKFILFDG